ncbi:ABC transporter substrate-binding protein [uncultured Winogradskyella sp.]|uniref:ABC transporter substrate-binding protein n=1 Tax=uncultured Winogradskyella sp. TaxID=395353 RepID=UPI003518915A
MLQVRIIIIALLFISCGEKTKKSPLASSEGKTLDLKYATGFSVVDYDTYKIITVTQPWPGADKTYKYVLFSDNETANHFSLDAVDAVINGSIEKVVVTSTTHIPHLELLGEEQTLVGFPGTDYISSKKTRALIDKGLIRELGKNESINTEVLLELDPDIVVGFGVEGVNKTFQTVSKSGIPVVYNGDWVESSPLAKAEWIKFFGVLYNKEKEADSIFRKIEQDYKTAKAIAQNSKKGPTVLSGAMHKDVWYLPNGSSPEAMLMQDANLNYLWEDTGGNGSLALSFEVVFDKAKDADLWLSPSYYTSLSQLEAANELYTNFKAFKTQHIFSFSVTTGATGGVLYYEMGSARPDLVLKDLIKIGHPELLKNYTPTFFKRLK